MEEGRGSMGAERYYGYMVAMIYGREQ